MLKSYSFMVVEACEYVQCGEPLLRSMLVSGLEALSEFIAVYAFERRYVDVGHLARGWWVRV